MLTENDRKDLKVAMQAALLDESQVVTENVVMENYVKKEVTYEQLLNLCFNPKRNDTYMESTKLEDVAKNYILEMVYSDAPSKAPKTSQDKYEVLESILYEKEGGKKGFEKIGSGIRKGAQSAAKKVGGSENLGSAVSKKGVRGKAAKGISKISSVPGSKGEKALGAAAVGAGALAAGTGAWYLYRKLRKKGVEKKKAAAAAAEAAKKKAQKTGASKDKETAQKWAQRARS